MSFLSFFSWGRSYYVNDPAKVARVRRNGELQENKTRANDEYDYIIVGGGTAGCVLASRLSEDPAVRVLVIEAGGSGKSQILSRIPILWPLLFHTKHAFNLETEPQEQVLNRRIYWPRGKLLGGCSSINAQMAHYGSPTDFDEWASITKDDSWSWAKFCRYFIKFENYSPNSEFPHVDAAAKGSKGPVKIGYNSFVVQTTKSFINACINAGIPFNTDFNGEKGTKGVNRTMTYIDNKGRRVSSETAYFSKDVLARPNLVVVTHSIVTKIYFSGNTGKTQAVGVEFEQSSAGPQYNARARREVILSAGAVHSTQVLLLSGVGPKEHLADHGIPLVQDLPGVGSRLQDHVIANLRFKDKSGSSLSYLKPRSLKDVFKLLSAAFMYFVFGKGPLACNVVDSAAFLRSDDPTISPQLESGRKLMDSTSGPDSPDLEILSVPLANKTNGDFIPDSYALNVALLRPLSTGTIRLRSANVWDQPIIDPGYLSHKDDLAKMVIGMRVSLKIVRTEPLAKFIDLSDTHPDLDHDLDTKSDEELGQIVRTRLNTVYHPVGTCRMAPLADGGVVDSSFRVYGIEGLRVCDASVFPEIVSGHTTGATYAVAEKLAEILKATS